MTRNSRTPQIVNQKASLKRIEVGAVRIRLGSRSMMQDVTSVSAT